MTPQEIVNYNSVYLDNWDTINDALVLHKMRLKSPDITPDEEALVSSRVLDLTYERGKLEAKYAARKHGGSVSNPPTDAQVAAAQQMAAESDQLIADQAGVQAAFTLASSAANLASAIQPG